MSEELIYFRSKKVWVNILILLTICAISLYIYKSLPHGYEEKHFSPDTIDSVISNGLNSISISHTSSNAHLLLDTEVDRDIIMKIRTLTPTSAFKSKGAKSTCKITINLINGDRAVIEVSRGYTSNHADIANFMTYSGNNSFFYDRYEATGLCDLIKNKIE